LFKDATIILAKFGEHPLVFFPRYHLADVALDFRRFVFVVGRSGRPPRAASLVKGAFEADSFISG
jgi:hypothetical protein